MVERFRNIGPALNRFHKILLVKKENLCIFKFDRHYYISDNFDFIKKMTLHGSRLIVFYKNNIGLIKLYK